MRILFTLPAIPLLLGCSSVWMVVYVDKMASTPMPSVANFWTNKQILFLFHKMLWSVGPWIVADYKILKASYWCYRTVNVERRKYLVQLVIILSNLLGSRGAILDTSRYNQYFQLKYFVLNKCYICFEHMIKICTQISIYRFFRYIHPIFFKFSKKYFKRGKFGHGGQFWTPLNMQKS